MYWTSNISIVFTAAAIWEPSTPKNKPIMAGFLLPEFIFCATEGAGQRPKLIGRVLGYRYACTSIRGRMYTHQILGAHIAKKWRKVWPRFIAWKTAPATKSSPVGLFGSKIISRPPGRLKGLILHIFSSLWSSNSPAETLHWIVAPAVESIERGCISRVRTLAARESRDRSDNMIPKCKQSKETQLGLVFFSNWAHENRFHQELLGRNDAQKPTLG